MPCDTIARFLPLLLAPCLGSCLGKATPAPSAGFAKPEGMRHNPELPFHRVWLDKTFDRRGRRYLFVAPVNTRYLLEHTWWEGVGRGSKAHQDVVELGKAFRQRVIEAFEMDEAPEYRVIDAAGLVKRRAETLILELAIVDLVPQKAVLQALTFPAGPLGILLRRGMDSRGATRIAMEGRLRDGASDRIVAKVADREQKKGGLINIKNFTWYAHVHEILGEWAEQFRQVSHKRPGQVIPDTPALRLLPW